MIELIRPGGTVLVTVGGGGVNKAATSLVHRTKHTTYGLVFND